MDGKDEALLCEGKCGLWFHRGCASIPLCQYKELTNSEEPFICLSCTNMQLKCEILVLKNELKGMAEVRDKCSTLTAEVSSLRDTINLLKGVKSLTTGHPKRSYARIARTHRTPHSTAANNKTQHTEAITLSVPNRSKANPVQSRPKRRVDGTSQGPALSQTTSRNQPSGKIVVDGARQLWGTHSETSSTAVKKAITRLCHG